MRMPQFAGRGCHRAARVGQSWPNELGSVVVASVGKWEGIVAKSKARIASSIATLVGVVTLTTLTTSSSASASPSPAPVRVTPHAGSTTCDGTLPTGTVVGLAATSSDGGYWIANKQGLVVACGDAPDFGNLPTAPVRPIVGIAATPDGGGYYLVGSDGGVFSFGDAHFQGSTSEMALNRPVVGIAVDPATGGYWLVASDGGIFAYNAPFYGSTGALKLNQPVVGIAESNRGTGYWLVASDGGIFAYDAPFYGSTGSIRLNKPVVGMAGDLASGGYWLVASDGGIFAYNALFYGSTGSIRLNTPVVGMEANVPGTGYRFVGSDGGVFTYGTSGFFGSAVTPLPPTTSVVIPSNGATLSGSTYLDASASNATSVKFLLFGGTYGYAAPVVCTATPTAYGWLCAWNTTTVPNGSYALVSEASNSAGNTFSKGVSISVTNPLPTTSIFIPSKGATLSGSTWLDAPASNATSVKFLLFGGTYGYAAPVVCTATPTAYGWLCAWNTTTVPNGSYALVSEAFNWGGSAFSSGVSINVDN
jgi:hypothetical protein